MSRIRSIHPGIWTDEDFVSLSPFARLLFIGLWNECDDKGAFPWSPLQMKMRLLPADNVDVAGLMAELEAANRVIRYEIGGKSYGAVRNFCKFQRPKKPNDVHPISELGRAYVGLISEMEEAETPASSEPDNRKREPVPNLFPTDGENAPQMEEGGDKGGDKGEEISPEGDCPSSDEPSLRPEHVVEHWNKLAVILGKPRVRDLTPERRALLKARIGQYSLDDFLTVFAKIDRSPFLRGDKDWGGCTFDWVFKKANFQKILEGNYDR